MAALAPPGIYLRIAARSGPPFEGIDGAGCVVGPDFRGEIKMIMSNACPRAHAVAQGRRAPGHI
eukprot:4991630-Pyramimonas_sp.AAC.1